MSCADIKSSFKSIIQGKHKENKHRMLSGRSRLSITPLFSATIYATRSIYNIGKLFGHFSTSLRNNFRAVRQARFELAFKPQLTKHSAFELLACNFSRQA